MNCASFVLFLLCAVGASDSARILVFYPGGSGSLLRGFTRLFGELHSRGHHLKVVTAFHLTALDKLDNVTQRVVPLKELNPHDDGFKKIVNMEFSPIQAVRIFWKVGGLIPCNNMMDHPVMDEILNSNETFDLFMGSPFYYHECDIVIPHLLRLPIVNLYSNRMSIHLAHQLGHQFPSSYVAEFNLPFTNDMGLLQRAVNVAFNLGYSFGLSWHYLPRMDALVHRKFPQVPPIGEMLSSVAVTLLNTDIAVHPAQPLPPGVIPVGGLTVSSQIELPPELDRWMDESTCGVLLFSLGSNLPVSAMDRPRLDALFAALGRLPLRVLMKWETDLRPDGMPDNVRLEKWIPQAAVLAHRHCRAFATHGGLHGWMESVYHAVPMVGLSPVFLDQKHNLAEMQAKGHGVRYEGPWTADGLYDAFNEVTTNPRYKESVSRASRVFRDQPMTPLQKAVYWTEYTIRHGGAPHLTLASARMPWHQTALLDVCAVAAVCAALVPLVLLLVVRTVKWTVSRVMRTVMCKAKEE